MINERLCVLISSSIILSTVGPGWFRTLPDHGEFPGFNSPRVHGIKEYPQPCSTVLDKQSLFATMGIS